MDLVPCTIVWNVILVYIPVVLNGSKIHYIGNFSENSHICKLNKSNDKHNLNDLEDHSSRLSSATNIYSL